MAAATFPYTMRLILAALTLVILALQVAATPVKRDGDSPSGYLDPSEGGGRMLTVRSSY